jgi:2'-5' RNA ligase
VQEAGLPADKKRYHPHLTIARIKRPDRAWIAGFLDEHASFDSEAFTAEAFTLYDSTLTWKGAVHRAFQRFPLEAQPSP